MLNPTPIVYNWVDKQKKQENIAVWAILVESSVEIMIYGLNLKGILWLTIFT